MDHQVPQPVFFGDAAHRLRELIREICKSMDIGIITGHVSKDHIHLFVSVPPQLSIRKVMDRIKVKTSRRLVSENVVSPKSFGIAICGEAGILQRRLAMSQTQ
jgi:putative transposase